MPSDTVVKLINYDVLYSFALFIIGGGVQGLLHNGDKQMTIERMQIELMRINIKCQAFGIKTLAQYLSIIKNNG